MSALLASGFHHWLVRWAPLAAWAVAAGTLALALATVRLARQARSEVREIAKQAGAVAREADAVKRQADAVAQQVEIGRDQLNAAQRQLEATQRPFVLPVTSGWRPDEFFPVEPRFGRAMGDVPEKWLMLANAGSGPAYNVRGGLFYRGGIGGGWQIIPTSLAAGQELPVMLETHPGLEPNWSEAVGYLTYSDLAGTEWQTHFRFHAATEDDWWIEIREVGRSDLLGKPEYTLDGGWQNPPSAAPREPRP